MGLSTLETMTVFRTHVLRSSAACLAVVLVLVSSPEWVAAQQVQTPKTQKVQKKAKPKAKAKAKAKAKVVLGKALGNTPAVKALASRLSAEHQLPKAWVQKQIASARLLPQVQQMVLPPVSPTAKNWQAYRSRFLQAARIQAGVAFARLHEEALKSAETRYGVPAAHLLGVLGVETFYGQHQGSSKCWTLWQRSALLFPKNTPMPASGRRFLKTNWATT